MDELFIAEGARLDELGQLHAKLVRRAVAQASHRWETDDEYRRRIFKTLRLKDLYTSRTEITVVPEPEYPWDLL